MSASVRVYRWADELFPPEPSPCRQGCKTKDHASYAECLKACNVQIGNLK